MKTWTLLGGDDEEAPPDSIGPQDVGGDAAGFSIKRRTLRGGLRDRVELVEIDNGRLSIVVIPTRGMGIHTAACDDVRLGWDSPVRGPVHPQFVPLMDPSGLGWLDGFDELVARCGLESNGAPEFDENGRLKYGLHGRIANRPAHHVSATVDTDAEEIRLTGIVEETRFHFQKLRLTSTVTTKFGSTTFRIHDTVENFSGVSSEFQLLYHLNFGPSILQPGARLWAPIAKLVPRTAQAAAAVCQWDLYGEPTPGFQEEVYLAQLHAQNQQTAVLLHNAAADRGVEIGYNTGQLPCFTQWKNTTSYADGYVTGLEPGTNFPNPRSFEKSRGRVMELARGESREFVIDVAALCSIDEVTKSRDRIAQLQSAGEPDIGDMPLANWCA